MGCCHPSGDLGSGVEPQLVQDAADMAVDGALRDEQARSDLLVAQAVSDQSRDLDLSFGEQSRSYVVSSRLGGGVWFTEGYGDGAAATKALAGAELNLEPGFAERRDG